MRYKTLLFLFLTLCAIGIINARRSSSSRSRGSSSRGSSSRSSTSSHSASRGSSSHGSSSSHSSSHGSSSHGSSNSHSGSYGSSSHGSSSTHTGSYGSNSHGSSSTHTGSYGSNSHGSPSSHSGSYGSNSHDSTGSRSSSGSYSSSGNGQHHQGTNVNTNFLNAEGGGATRPGTSHPPSTHLQTGQTVHNNKPGTVTESKQSASPYAPSAPTATVLNQGGLPSSSGSWSNPHFNPNQPYNPSQTHPQSNHYPGSNQPNSPSQPQSPGNPHYPPNHSSQTHPVYHPHYSTYHRHNSSQTHSVSNSQPNSNQPNMPSQTNLPWSHPHSTSNYPVSQGHPPPPIGFKDHVYPSYSPPIHQQNSMPMGNPYALHPSGNVHTTGPIYNPQPQMFAQPAMQPFVPGQTVLMMQPDHGSGRGIGDMVKEALVYSTINAGINRLINPHHTHYVESRPDSAQTTTTHITYNNHYFNTPPGTTDTSSTVPQGTVNGGIGTVPAGNIPTGNIPTGNIPAGNIPTGNIPTGNIPTGNIPAGNIPTGNIPTGNIPTGNIPTGNIPTGNIATGNMASGNIATGNTVAPTMQPNPTTKNQTNSPAGPNINNNALYKISDNEIFRITEDLFAMSHNISKYIKLNLQKQSTSPNVTDEARQSLFQVDPAVLEYPSIYVTHTLYDSYEHDFQQKINRTKETREHENLLIDTYLNTNVMAMAMQWLGDRGFIDPDDFERKDVLRRIWFTTFSGSTCGFERVFESENYGTAIIGVQDWLYFANRESSKRINYMGYTNQLKLGNTASLLKLNFEMDGIVRPNATIFVGTTPELEMALYTICFYARSNDLCPISLGGSRFNIYTHSFFYFGNLVMDLAIPVF